MQRFQRHELAFIDFSAGVGLEEITITRKYKTLGHTAVAIMRVKKRADGRKDLWDAIDAKRKELGKHV